MNRIAGLEFSLSDGRPAAISMDVEVVDDEMNRGGVSILPDQVAGDGSEFGGRAIRRSKSEVLSGLRLHGAEDIGRAAALVFTVLPRLAARDGR